MSVFASFSLFVREKRGDWIRLGCEINAYGGFIWISSACCRCMKQCTERLCGSLLRAQYFQSIIELLKWISLTLISTTPTWASYTGRWATPYRMPKTHSAARVTFCATFRGLALFFLLCYSCQWANEIRCVSTLLDPSQAPASPRGISLFISSNPVSHTYPQVGYHFLFLGKQRVCVFFSKPAISSVDKPRGLLYFPNRDKKERTL